MMLYDRWLGSGTMRWLLVLVLVGVVAPMAQAAISWDGQAGTNWWFDPVNWGFANAETEPPFYLPPSNGNSFQARDAVISNNWNFDGEGVVYDPANDPHYAAAAGPDVDYPTEEDPRFDRDTLWRMYVTTDAATGHNKVTMKSGTLEFISKATSLNDMGQPDGGSLNATIIIGRGSPAASPGYMGIFVQEGGSFLTQDVSLDVGHFHGSPGTGIYEYRGGILEAGVTSFANGIRLGHAGSATAAGHGTFVMRNGGAPGYVRVWNFTVGSNLGASGTNSDGVGVVRFHANADGTRPIQVMNNLSINHQDDTAGSGNRRSSVLELVLDAAPQVDGSGIPINLGLFDVDSDNNGFGDITGTPSPRYFHSDSWANDGQPYLEGDLISAVLGNTQYNWNISYTGNITWSNPDTGVVSLVEGPGTGRDVVLIGHSSELIAACIPGDFNCNGAVENADLTLLLNNWGNAVPPIPAGWTGAEPTAPAIDNDELTLLLNNWGTVAGGGSLAGNAAVPEPASAALALLGLLLFLGGRGTRFSWR